MLPFVWDGAQFLITSDGWVIQPVVWDGAHAGWGGGPPPVAPAGDVDEEGLVDRLQWGSGG
jgi:hypothetical protein